MERKSIGIFLLGLFIASSIFATLFALQLVVPAQQLVETNAPPETLEKFKVYTGIPGFEGIFLVIDAGKDRGIFAKHGLDPEFVDPQKPNAAVAVDIKEHVGSGVRIGINVPSEVIIARADGVPVKIVAGYIGTNPLANLYVRGDSELKTIEDLDGRKIGVNQLDHWTGRYALWLSDNYGINIERVPVGNTTNRVVALKLGTIDAYIGANLSPLRLVDSGELKILMSFSDVWPIDFTILELYATDDLIDNNPELVRRFVAAWLEAVRYLKDNPGYAAELYIRKTNGPQDLADQVASIIDWRPDGRGRGDDLVFAVANDWAFQVAGGITTIGEVNVEETVDIRFLP